MEKAEAITILERIKRCMDINEVIEALGLALTALRGPTRQMVERMRGEWIEDEFAISHCPLCGYEQEEPELITPFCPLCGSPMTDEAVDMMLERWKEAFDENSTMGGMLFDTAEDAISALSPPNEWVSVEERLPEVGQEVLVYWRNTSQKAEHFELTHYDGNHWFLLDNTERPWIVVVAWTPLPAPPDRRPPEGVVLKLGAALAAATSAE